MGNTPSLLLVAAGAGLLGYALRRYESSQEAAERRALRTELRLAAEAPPTAAALSDYIFPMEAAPVGPSSTALYQPTAEELALGTGLAEINPGLDPAALPPQDLAPGIVQRQPPLPPADAAAAPYAPRGNRRDAGGTAVSEFALTPHEEAALRGGLARLKKDHRRRRSARSERREERQRRALAKSGRKSLGVQAEGAEGAESRVQRPIPPNPS